jgi:hypothetical protein
MTETEEIIQETLEHKKTEVNKETEEIKRKEETENQEGEDMTTKMIDQQ